VNSKILGQGRVGQLGVDVDLSLMIARFRGAIIAAAVCLARFDVGQAESLGKEHAQSPSHGALPLP
jgi:hypothetical protein